MSILVAVILGIVQGLTEFLPVSSSGHLVLLERLFVIKADLIFLNVVLHLGTLLAVVLYYRKRLWGYLKKPFQKDVGYLALATVPTVIIFLLFKSFIQDSFSGDYLVIGFLVTATILVIANFIMTKQTAKKVFDYKTALVMGVFQGLAMVPGVSRSGSTITSGVVYGCDKNKVADFSFLMSIPVILASLVFELFELSSTSLSIGVLPLIVGFVFAFVFGLLAIKFMLKIIAKAQFYWFSIYLVILSIILLFVNI